MKRYVKEYANDKVKLYRSLAREYPSQRDDFYHKIDAVNRAVWLFERGYIIVDETMRLISEA